MFKQKNINLAPKKKNTLPSGSGFCAFFFLMKDLHLPQYFTFHSLPNVRN